MNAPNTSAESATPPRQSRLSEAVEQATDTARLWYEDLAGLAKSQANALSSGDYGMKDLITGQVDLLRIWTKNGIAASTTLSDNLALLTSPPPPTAARSCKARVSVQVPTTCTAEPTVSDLVGLVHRHHVPASNIQLTFDPPLAAGQAGNYVATVTVSVDNAPKGIYEGCIRSADGSVSQPFMIPLC